MVVVVDCVAPQKQESEGSGGGLGKELESIRGAEIVRGSQDPSFLVLHVLSIMCPS